MSEIINLLPDFVANQIAAGEVVQRPASVIKELIENAIDAQANEIHIHIIDAGRTLIQITDNGIGMSNLDARMAFERHATSKIKSADDIFSIRSMGFRGEALASIAAVAHVELKTRRKEDEVGTKLIIKGSEIESQTPDACPVGSSFSIKNLFYNVPARRKFLKSNNTEFKYILAEIYHTAIAHNSVAFTIHKDNELFAHYPASHAKQRIINMFGKRFEKGLLSIEGETSIVKITGFVGTPDLAKKNNFDQYFFVNNRYFRQRSFQIAVVKAYEQLISPKEYPPFFIFLEIDPAQIDVNIHPTKTEIKFIEEYNICNLIEASVKHSLGKSNIVPSLDFDDTNDYSDMFSFANSSKQIKIPTIDVKPHYNPFDSYAHTAPQKTDTRQWEQLFSQAHAANHTVEKTFESSINTKTDFTSATDNVCIQIQKKYILTPVKTGIMLIDIKRAHSRILYEKYILLLEDQQQPSQKTLLPHSFDCSHAETENICALLPQLQQLGFDIELFGKQSFVINGIPADVSMADAEETIRTFVDEYTESSKDITQDTNHHIAVSLAKSAALHRNPTMLPEEMQTFLAQLFQCKAHSLSADGKLAIVILEYNELLKKFNTP